MQTIKQFFFSFSLLSSFFSYLSSTWIVKCKPSVSNLDISQNDEERREEPHRHRRSEWKRHVKAKVGDLWRHLAIRWWLWQISMAASIGLASLQRGICHPVLLAVLPYPGAAGTLVQDRGTNVFKSYAEWKVKFNYVAMAFVEIPN